MAVLLCKCKFEDNVKFIRLVRAEGVDLVHEFSIAAKKTFGIAFDAELKICDRDGVELMDYLEDYIDAFHGQDTVYQICLVQKPTVELTALGETLLTPKSVSEPTTDLSLVGSSNEESDKINLQSETPSPSKFAKGLKHFLVTRGFDVDGPDTESRKRSFVQLTVEYLVDKYSLYPNKIQKIEVAKEAISVYPRLKIIGTPDGYEAMYDPATRGGYIEWRLKTIRERINREKKAKQALSATVTATVSASTDETPSYPDQSDYLKEASVNAEKEKIIKVSKESALNRHKFILENPKINIYAEFPRFFDVPELVDIDFKENYPNAQKLEDWWVVHAETIEPVLNDSYDRKLKEYVHNLCSDWEDDVKHLLQLVILLKPGNYSKKSSSTSGVIEALVQFKKESVPLDEFLITNSESIPREPFIILEGTSKADINRFLVIVDRHPLPPLDKFLQAFDICFKCHFVFNLQYHSLLHYFYLFFENYAYKIAVSGETKCSSKMRQLFTRLSQKALESKPDD